MRADEATRARIDEFETKVNRLHHRGIETTKRNQRHLIRIRATSSFLIPMTIATLRSNCLRTWNEWVFRHGSMTSGYRRELRIGKKRCEMPFAAGVGCYSFLRLLLVDRGVVRAEIAIADIDGKPIYPIWAAGDTWRTSITMTLLVSQYIDARDTKYMTAIDAIELLAKRPDVGTPTLAYGPRKPNFHSS